MQAPRGEHRTSSFSRGLAFSTRVGQAAAVAGGRGRRPPSGNEAWPRATVRASLCRLCLSLGTGEDR